MNSATLPDNVDELKEIIATLAPYKERVETLEEENRRLRSELHGRKSEKVAPQDEKQSHLFNELETHQIEETTEAAAPEKIEVKSHERKKPGRKPLPDDLPVEEVYHDIPEEEKRCKCGAEKSRIGTEDGHELDIVPQKLYIRRHKRFKYACKKCQGTADESKPAVVTAPLPKRMIDRCMVAAGFLAHIIASKFVDHLPFYRLEKILLRYGVEISRASMCNWAVKIHQRCRRLLILMAVEARSGPLIGIDETSVQVLKERGRSPTQKSYMWVMRGGSPEKPIHIFRYRRSRTAKFLKRYLRGYQGIIQTDGYQAYHNLGEELQIKHVVCWAHVRRKFFELLKTSKKAKVARIAIDIIQKLYAVEAEADAKNLTTVERLSLRREKSAPVVAEFRGFLDSKTNVTPKSLMGKAVQYANKQWPKLQAFLEDGNIPIDNNMVENAIRPFVIGRKNWLFSDTTHGARASAGLYSLIETAKANSLEPYWYLRYLFEKLPEATTDEELIALLPTHLSGDQIDQKSTT